MTFTRKGLKILDVVDAELVLSLVYLLWTRSVGYDKHQWRNDKECECQFLFV